MTDFSLMFPAGAQRDSRTLTDEAFNDLSPDYFLDALKYGVTFTQIKEHIDKKQQG